MHHALPLTLLPFALATLVASGCASSTKKHSAAAAPAGTSTQAAAGGGPVNVAETEYAIKPSAVVASAGKVSFDVSNDGVIPHEFVVIKTDKQAANLLKGVRADETGKVGKLDEKALGVKAKKTLTLNLKPGHYALICNLPGHYQGGMYSDFTVK